MKEFLKKELYVALHGQTARFRIVKYIVLFAVFGALYWWKGWEAVLWALAIGFIAAIGVHFFFRWKSKGWNEKWGLYTPPEGMPK